MAAPDNSQVTKNVFRSGHRISLKGLGRPVQRTLLAVHQDLMQALLHGGSGSSLRCFGPLPPAVPDAAGRTTAFVDSIIAEGRLNGYK